MKIFSDELINEACQTNHVADLGHATIGEVLLVAQFLEQKTGIPFIRMDQGSPGLPEGSLRSWGRFTISSSCWCERIEGSCS